MPTAPRGFTLVEALVALSITAIAGAVLLLSVDNVLSTTNDAVDRTIAQGMANQLIDEVVGLRYCESDNPHEFSLGPTGSENRGVKRDRYDDTDDFDGYEASPPRDRWGNSLGQMDNSGDGRPSALRSSTTEFQQWRQKIAVYYVSASNPDVRLPDWLPSDYRAVEVIIEREAPNGAVRPLAQVRRVFCYVPAQ